MNGSQNKNLKVLMVIKTTVNICTSFTADMFVFYQNIFRYGFHLPFGVHNSVMTPLKFSNDDKKLKSVSI